MATDPPTPTAAQTPEQIAATNEQLKISKDLTNEYGDALTRLGTLAGESAQYINLLGIAATGSSKAFESFGQNTDKLASFSAQLGVLEKVGSLTIGAMQNLASKAGLGTKAFSMTAEALKPFITNLAQAADDTINFQQGTLGMAGATGSLGKIFEESGKDLENLNDVMRKHQSVIHTIADSTHTTAEEVAKFSTLIGSAMPDAFLKQISVTDATGKSLGALEAAMGLARGTGRSVADVTKDMTTAYESFNMQGNEALEWTARMTELSTKFNVPLSYTEGFLSENAKAFSMLSDKVGTADVTFNRMFKSLKDTGLSAKQSVTVISEMESGLSKLTTAQKAFLSAQSGGPGGLRGAAHIDNLIREGKTDEVMKMAENNLRNHFGGKIYTQKEAEGSDQAASQFYKQQQMLKSGAFGGLVTSDASATRLLEAMSAGTSAKEALKDPSEGLQGSVDKGQKLQQTTNTILLDLLHTVQQGKSMGGYQVLDYVQKNIGSTKRSDRAGDAAYRAEMLRENEDKAKVKTLGNNTAIKEGKPIDSIEIENAANLRRAGRTVESALPERLRKVINTALSNVTASPEGKEGGYTAARVEAELAKGQRDVAKKMAAGGNQIKDFTPIPNDQGNFLGAAYKQDIPSRGVGTARAVGQAQAIGKPDNQHTAQAHRTAAGKPGDAPVQNAKHDVTVHIAGVMCSRCHHPVQTSSESKVVTSGT